MRTFLPKYSSPATTSRVDTRHPASTRSRVRARGAAGVRRQGQGVSGHLGLIGDLMRGMQKRIMTQHQLQAADPHGGGGDP